MEKPIHSNQASRIYIGNIYYGVTVKDITWLCGEFGPVKDIFLPKRNKKNNKGFAFVEFESEDDAKTAIEKLNGLEWKKKRNIVCRKAVERKKILD
jgi:RNA recognition motif-containing protein